MIYMYFVYDAFSYSSHDCAFFGAREIAGSRLVSINVLKSETKTIHFHWETPQGYAFKKEPIVNIKK